MAAPSPDGRTAPLAVQRREEASFRFAILMTVLAALCAGLFTADVPPAAWVATFTAALAGAGVLAWRWRAA